MWLVSEVRAVLWRTVFNLWFDPNSRWLVSNCTAVSPLVSEHLELRSNHR